MAAGRSHLCLPLYTIQHGSDRPDFMYCDGRLTSSHAFVRRVAQLSHGLSQLMGLQPGAVVMVASLNTDWMLEVLLSISDAGCIANPINHRWSSSELCAAMSLTQPSWVMSDAHCLGLVQDSLDMLQAQSSAVAPFLMHLGAAHGQAARPGFSSMSPSSCEEVIATMDATQGQPELQLKQPDSGAALICFTSGTTGAPKGVVLSHTAFHAQSLAKLAVVGYQESDVYMHVAPLFHIGGLSSAFACIMAGSRHVLLPKYTAQQAFTAIQQQHVTSFIAVPTIMQDLVSHASHVLAGQQGTPVTCVSCILMGGGVTSPDLQASITRWFPAAHVYSAYGMTEACSSMTFQTLMTPTAHQGPSVQRGRRRQHANNNIQSVSLVQLDMNTHQAVYESQAVHSRCMSSQQQAASDLYAGAVCAGRAAPGVALRIAPLGDSTQQGAQTACVHVVGEVWTRGPHTMSCYWRNENETHKVLMAGGWLRTGDLGFLDLTGNLWLKGRAKDMIKSGGENVYAAEVEAALCEHPDVQAAVVVGIPDARWGEVVAALVTLKPGVSWSGPVIDPQVWTGPTQLPPPAAQEPPTTQLTAHSTTHRGPGEPQQPPATHVTPQGLQDFCRHTAGLSPYKLPRHTAAVLVSTPAPSGTAVQLLPVNASGKVLKDKVKAALAQVYHSSGSDLVGIRSKL